MAVVELNYKLDFEQKLPPAAQEAIADGMAQADENADHFWKVIVDGCILAAARRLPLLTVDDVLDELEKINEERKKLNQPLFGTHNYSALGPAMKRAAKNRIMVATDSTKRSHREIKHGNRHTVWSSRVYAGGQK